MALWSISSPIVIFNDYWFLPCLTVVYMYTDNVKVVKLVEPQYTAVGLLPRGRYRFLVRQMTMTGVSEAISTDVTLTQSIRKCIYNACMDTQISC